MELKQFVGNKIKELRLSRGMNQDVLAELLKTTKQSISRYETGERQANQDMLFKLSSVFNVDIDIFFPPRAKEKELVDNAFIPLYGNIAAGTLSTVDSVTNENLEHICIPKLLLGKYADNTNLFAMIVNGDSMNKTIQNGSYVIAKKVVCDEIKDDDIVIFSHDNEYSMKRVRRDSEDKVLIFSAESHNRKFRDIEVSYDTQFDLKIFAKVIWYSTILN